jgi:hypothetical protein
LPGPFGSSWRTARLFWICATTLATELVQSATKGSSATAMADMGRDATDAQQTRSSISENWIRAFWRGYQELMKL